MVTFIGEVTYNNVQRFNKELLLRETTAPSATDGYGSLYVQADGYLYYKDFDGTQTNLTNVGAATPAGSDREIQFNDAGALGASSSLSLSASNELILDGYAYLNSGLAIAANAGIGGNLTVDGSITVSVGSVGAPGFAFYPDSDTGMWHSADNTIAWSNGGTEYMRLDSSGYLLLHDGDTFGYADLVVNKDRSGGFVTASIRNRNAAADSSARFDLYSQGGSSYLLLINQDSGAQSWTFGNSRALGHALGFYKSSNLSGNPVAAIDYISGSGRMCVGGTTLTNEILQVSGGVLVGAAIGTTNGTIQWDGSNLQVRHTGTWINLDESLPGGSDTQVQFNNAGTLDGSANLTYDETNTYLHLLRNTAGDVEFQVQNTSADPSSNAIMRIYTDDAGGDPTLFHVCGGDYWYQAIDSSDSNIFKFGYGSTIGSNLIYTADPGGGVIDFSGDLATSSAADWDLIDNNSSALSFDSTGKAGILNIDTTDGYEGISFSGYTRIGNTSDTTSGNIRWDGSNFQGYDGSDWIALDSQSGNVIGDGYISGNLIVGGNIQVDGYSYLNGVAVAGDAGISGDLVVSNDVTIGDNLTLIGYASVAGDLNVTGEIHNTQLQNTLDGYALSATENTHWIEGVEQRQSIRDALDGYSTLTTAQGADGYIAFFTGSDSIAGDNDLFYNRATGDVIIGGGGDLSISGDVTVGVADGYSSLIIYGTVYNPLPGQLAPSGSNTEIDLSEGNSRVLNLMNVSGSTLTVTLSNYKEGASYVIKVIQHPSSAKNVTFTGVLWEGSSAPTISAGASAVDIISFWSDGVSLYGSYIQNLS